MDFARSQLEKYGWKTGEGLGKHKTGISKPIKAKLKNDRGGLGHDIGEEFCYNWWEASFNNAASRISVSVDKSDVTLKTNKSDKPFEISTKRTSVQLSDNKDETLLYGRFQKVARLVGSSEEQLLESSEAPSEESVSRRKVEEPLSDEQLFLACGGRTAHKAARHNLGLNGKLLRLEKQEQKIDGSKKIEPHSASSNLKKSKHKKHYNIRDKKNFNNKLL